MRTSRKGLGGSEFTVIFVLLLVVFVFFFARYSEKFGDLSNQKELDVLMAMGESLLAEFQLAHDMSPDYQRTFVIEEPQGYEFMDIELSDPGELTLTFQDTQHFTFIPFDVRGVVYYGEKENQNTVYKVDGIIFLPNGSRVVREELAGVFLNVNPESCLLYNLTGTCQDLVADHGEDMSAHCLTFANISCTV